MRGTGRTSRVAYSRALVFAASFLASYETAQAQVMWQVPPSPEFSVGTEDGEFSQGFFGIHGAVRLDDGRIVVADRGQRLVEFDAAGQYLRTVGREGHGPGEFVMIEWFARLPGDSLMVWDAGTQRISWYTSDLELARDLPVRAVPPPSVVGRFADGALLARHFVPIQAGTRGFFTYRSSYVRLDPSGTMINQVAEVQGGEAYNGGSRGTRILGSGELLKKTRVVVGEERVYVATGDKLEVMIYGQDGSGQGSIRRSSATIRTTDEDIVELSWDAAMAATLRGNLPPEHALPSISGLLLDEHGNLWIGEFIRDGQAVRTWWVFDAQRRPLATVPMPGPFSPTQIGEGFVLGVWKDQWDVESVRFYWLERN